MPAATYPLRAIVLRRTKLAETDLIVTFLAEDGRQVRAVAKGARKPSSPFACRLDIFAEVEMLLACGKSLDVVKEARLLDAHRDATADMEHACAAAPLVDLAARLTQPDLESPRLFALTSSALTHLGAASEQGALAICAAYALKAFAFAGFRPSLRRCVVCGAPLDLDTAAQSRALVPFSAAEGGVACPGCLLFSDTVRIPIEVLSWADYLMMTPFDGILAQMPPARVSFEVLHLCQTWVREHVGARLKSLEFLFTCGLF